MRTFAWRPGIFVGLLLVIRIEQPRCTCYRRYNKHLGTENRSVRKNYHAWTAVDRKHHVHYPMQVSLAHNLAK